MGRFNISKGDRFKIAKSAGLSKIKAQLIWNAGFDLDAEAFLCGNEGVILDDAGFVFYNSENREHPFDRAVYGSKHNWQVQTRPMSADGAVLGSIDDRDGGDGEVITVDLDKVDPQVSEIVFTTSIHDEGKTFGSVSNATIVIINDETGDELCSYELDEAFTEETAVSVAKLILNDDGEWEFEAVGMGHVGGLETLIDIYAS